MRSRSTTRFTALAALFAVGGCNLFLGLDQFRDACPEVEQGKDCPEGGGGNISTSTSASTSSTGGTNAGGGGSGGAPQCIKPGDCPASGTACVAATCAAGACATKNAEPRTPCSDNGGSICDGNGVCTTCTEGADCQSGICQGGACAKTYAWSERIGDASSRSMGPVVTNGSHIYVAGTSNAIFEGTETRLPNYGYVSELDTNGKALWTTSLQSTAASLALTASGQVLAGGTQVTRLDATGNVLSAVDLAGLDCVATGVLPLPNGGFVIGGGYNDYPCDFGDGPEGIGGALFVVGFDASNHKIWKYVFTGLDIAAVVRLGFDSAGHIVVASTAPGDNINFGGGAVPGGSTFFTKLNSDGSHVSTRSYPTPNGYASFDAFAIDTSDRMYTGGYIIGTVDFGAGAMNDAAGGIYAGKFASDGTPTWTKNYAGDGGTVGAIMVASGGDVLFGGSFKGTMNFGGQQLVSAGNGQFEASLAAATGAPLKIATWGSGETRGLAALGSGVIATGTIGGDSDFGGGKFTPGLFDGFVTKHGSDDSFKWADRAVANGDQIVTSVDVDLAGDAYAFGTYRYSAEGGPLLGSPFTSGDQTDLFILKRSPAGVPTWAMHAGGTGDDTIVGRADATGNTFLTGSHAGNLSFGGAPMVASAGAQIYLAKLDPSGTKVFQNQYGVGTSTAIALTPAGGPVIAGFAPGAIQFGGSGFISGMVVAQFDAAGNYTFSSGYSATSAVIQPSAIAVGPDNAIYLSGTFAGQVQIQNCNVNAAGTSDFFFVRLDPMFHQTSNCRHFGTSVTTAANSMAVDAANNVYIAGSFQSGINFGLGTLTSKGGSDIFVAKFDSAGAPVWAQQYGGTGDDAAVAIGLAPNGDLVVSGSFSSTVNFGTGDLKSAGSTDAFVLHVDSTGKTLYAARFGDASKGDTGRALAVDATGATLLGGTAGGSIDFGGGAFTGTGALDGFLVKLNASP